MTACLPLGLATVIATLLADDRMDEMAEDLAEGLRRGEVALRELLVVLGRDTKVPSDPEASLCSHASARDSSTGAGVSATVSSSIV